MMCRANSFKSYLEGSGHSLKDLKQGCDISFAFSTDLSGCLVENRPECWLQQLGCGSSLSWKWYS